jgi:hypothetical protein
MPKRIVSSTHQWEIAALISADDRDASKASLRGYLRCEVDRRIEAIDVYCVQCRRTYDQVGDRECEAAKSNEHLIGGPTGERAKRVHTDHDCAMYGCVRDVEADRQAVGYQTGA